MSLANPQGGRVPLSSFAAAPDRAFSRSRPRVPLQSIFQALAVRVPQSLAQQSPGPESRPWRGAASPWFLERIRKNAGPLTSQPAAALTRRGFLCDVYGGCHGAEKAESTQLIAAGFPGGPKWLVGPDARYTGCNYVGLRTDPVPCGTYARLRY